MSQGKSKQRLKDERGNQEDRFLKAFDEYAEALFRHATVRLSDRERAIELVHDAYTKAWGYIRNGHEVDAFRPFLYKILNNLIIDEYRNRKRGTASLDAILEEDGIDEGIFDELRDVSHEALIDTLDAKQAIEVIYELPDVYRESIVLRFVDGLGPKEISVLIEENENVVSVRIHRGIKLLRDIIDTKQGRKNEVAQEATPAPPKKRSATKKRKT